jgi:hypothetical protein
MSVFAEMSSCTALKKQLGSSPAFRFFLTQRSQVGCLDLGLFGLREHSKSMQVQKCASLMDVSFSLVRSAPVDGLMVARVAL